MGTLLLIGFGVFLGWLLFRPQKDKGKGEKQAVLTDKDERGLRDATMQNAVAGRSQAAYPKDRNHMLRSVAGGVAAGAILGHILSGDKKTVNQEITNDYTSYLDNYDYEEYKADDDLLWDDDEGEIGDAANADYDFDYEDLSDSSAEDSDWNDSDDDEED
ncbi:MAG: hypothetical protein K6F01_05280 [Selenomonas sp.]|uniref:hypothetical protein n=1 Tax=Selenomonas sp. TaxID=2053611 RepID=UPI0025FBD9C6|nr:hypothetical protein [Selenomonas sp.]MCR5438831.1 hypothetical protein [Selenomonas sp.]